MRTQGPRAARPPRPAARLTPACSQDELFEWHFTIAGPPDTPFEGGRFHGRIVMPPDYPMKPPDVYLSTPNGARADKPHALSARCRVGRWPSALNGRSVQVASKPTRRYA